MGPNTPSTRIVRFGVYECDLIAGELHKSGVRLQLSDQPFRLLSMLLDRPGELVTRQELQERLWPNQPYGEFNDGLNTAINKLRTALCDNPENPQFIETIPRRGYRFIASVRIDPSVENPRPEASEQRAATAPGRGSTLRRRIIIGGTAVVVAIVILAVARQVAFRKAAARERRISLVVMPFQNLSGDSANDYLAKGLTEEITTRFVRDYGGGLKVIQGGLGAMDEEPPSTSPQAASNLGTEYLIEGSVRGKGAHLRVAARLIRGRGKTELWADSYDGDASQLLQFEASVARSVAAALSVKLLPGRSHPYIPSSFAAHDDYLHGLYYLSERSRHGFDKAVVSFAAATASDPHYARAYAELAVTYDLMGQYNWINPAYARSLGQAAAEQAIADDPSLAEAHAALGLSAWFYNWDPAQGERELKRAIALAPDNVDAHHWYSQLLMTSGRYSEAEKQMRAALALDPQSLILQTNLGLLYYYERRYPEAIAQIKRVLQENPEFLTAHYKLWWAYSASGDPKDAWNELRDAAREMETPQDQLRLTTAYQKSGYGAACDLFSNHTDPNDYGSFVDSARALVWAGHDRQALARLDQAFEAKDGWMIFAVYDPAFTPLHNNPQFGRLVEQVKPLDSPAS